MIRKPMQMGDSCKIFNHLPSEVAVKRVKTKFHRSLFHKIRVCTSDAMPAPGLKVVHG